MSSTSSSIEKQYITKPKFDNVVYCWKIENFDFYEARGADLRSSTFSAVTNDKYKWYLELGPNGEKNSTNKYISIYLNLIFPDALLSVFAKYTIDFLVEEVEVFSTSSSVVREFTSVNDSWGYPEISKTLVLSENKLSIRCRVTFSEMNAVSPDGMFSHCLKSEASDSEVIDNLASLFENQEFSDVIISVKSKKYAVHKCILAARSPVFAAMFRHDTKEKQLNRVNIDDIDENVMDEMLRYIYTGRCENLDSIAEPLLAAADKYALDRLKTICSKKLNEILSVENAAKILLLSDMHCVDELRTEVVKFIVDNSGSVFGTDGWRNMLTHPHLIDLVCQAMALR